MTSKKELQLAYGLVIVLFVVGVLSYAAFSAKTPDQPVRLMFKSVAGKVLFDHKTHTDDSGYGISCQDCHHHPEEDETDFRACGECHSLPPEGETLSMSCADCHEPDEIEGTEMIKKGDAFHSQCIDCHKANEAGPEECASCHVM
ncbi:MAG: cytochrome c3 family protein [Deltaproteobacteria bacterium]|nr:cytochrome c3 family protein [Deltaproteobacteria bacterium]MBW2199611.1 cytochrome c3 family protein [Deltaproteobacteria bacterium]MBW2538033.1 cytochrome c3 family protein [Deltaproteobacteria bacterium]